MKKSTDLFIFQSRRSTHKNNFNPMIAALALQTSMKKFVRWATDSPELTIFNQF